MKLADALPEHLRGSRPVEVLERSLERKRLAHGILLHGEDLGTLEAIALSIAQHLLQSELPPVKHPDCFFVRPAGKTRIIPIGRKEGGEFPPNSIRYLVGNVQKSSHGGGRKVGILVEADRMNIQAANAFLKTLEEPPEDTTLFLLSTRPYDLLDTIRSRCFNFRIPADSPALNAVEWQSWLDDYQSWIGKAVDGPRAKSEIAEAIFGAYGLNARFQILLTELTKTSVKLGREDLPEDMTDDQQAALEAGLSRGLRKQLYAQIERATAAFAKRRLKDAPETSTKIILALNHVTEALEKTSGLLELNLNEAAAFELFLLKSLRIWARART